MCEREKKRIAMYETARPHTKAASLDNCSSSKGNGVVCVNDQSKQWGAAAKVSKAHQARVIISTRAAVSV